MPPKIIAPGLLRAFQQVGRDLFIQGLNSSHSGNLSARDRDIVWVTRRGAPLGRLAARDLVSVSIEDPDSKADLASSELPVHLEIHAPRAGSAVVHAHPPAAVALSLSSERIEPADLEGRYYLRRVRVLPAPEPYDPKAVAGAVAEALSEDRVVVIRGHGAFSVGSDLWEAFHWCSALEHSCRILLLTRVSSH
ncbi:MAG: class II aldolase/adducin family protein [Thermodesulfobacteriota bacterium]